ncbi:MAG: 1-acyl-sn-glycerol-3-phosphate acyltransferase [Oscillospiraceae bacterium]|jgi:1-acyl-sn-glycerol-3-phosphate acyltransferase|nr:1-acyl-sn-glycerol-3-phosphate acyltransferase [Oscillospiraceae bacterium]
MDAVKNTDSMNKFYKFAIGLMKPFIKLFFRLDIHGLENVPESGGLVLAANHRSNWDPLYLAVILKSRMLHFMAKRELWKFPPLGKLIEALGAYPVNRGRRDVKAIETARNIIKKGQILAIFPEGHRSFRGEPLPVQSGVGLIAAQTGADVLPISIYCDGKVGFFKKITIRFGQIIKNHEFNFSNPLRSSERKAASRMIMERIHELAGLRHAEDKQGRRLSSL